MKLVGSYQAGFAVLEKYGMNIRNLNQTKNNINKATSQGVALINHSSQMQNILERVDKYTK